MTQVNLQVINDAYGFTIDIHGEVHGLVAGDMGYAPTGIKLDGDSLAIWELGVKAWDEQALDAADMAYAKGYTAGKSRARFEMLVVAAVLYFGIALYGRISGA